MRGKVALLSLLGISIGAVFSAGCQSESGNYSAGGAKSIHLPTGWELGPQTTMLARSYPFFSWITLIIRGNTERIQAFSTPLPKPAPKRRKIQPNPYYPLLFPFSNLEMPDSDKFGIKFSAKSNRNINLVLQIPLTGGGGFYAAQVSLPKKKFEWNYIQLPFCQFEPSSPSLSKQVPFKEVRRLEFWLLNPGGKKQRVTLTLTPPKLFKLKAKEHRNKCRQKRRARPTSKPSSRSGSKPTAKKNDTNRSGSKPTTKKSDTKRVPTSKEKRLRQ